MTRIVWIPFYVNLFFTKVKILFEIISVNYVFNLSPRLTLTAFIRVFGVCLFGQLNFRVVYPVDEQPDSSPMSLRNAVVRGVQYIQYTAVAFRRFRVLLSGDRLHLALEPVNVRGRVVLTSSQDTLDILEEDHIRSALFNEFHNLSPPRRVRTGRRRVRRDMRSPRIQRSTSIGRRSVRHEGTVHPFPILNHNLGGFRLTRSDVSCVKLFCIGLFFVNVKR